MANATKNRKPRVTGEQIVNFYRQVRVEKADFSRLVQLTGIAAAPLIQRLKGIRENGIKGKTGEKVPLGRAMPQLRGETSSGGNGEALLAMLEELPDIDEDGDEDGDDAE